MLANHVVLWCFRRLSWKDLSLRSLRRRISFRWLVVMQERGFIWSYWSWLFSFVIWLTSTGMSVSKTRMLLRVSPEKYLSNKLTHNASHSLNNHREKYLISTIIIKNSHHNLSINDCMFKWYLLYKTIFQFFTLHNALWSVQLKLWLKLCCCNKTCDLALCIIIKLCL